MPCNCNKTVYSKNNFINDKTNNNSKKCSESKTPFELFCSNLTSSKIETFSKKSDNNNLFDVKLFVKPIIDQIKKFSNGKLPIITQPELLKKDKSFVENYETLNGEIPLPEIVNSDPDNLKFDEFIIMYKQIFITGKFHVSIFNNLFEFILPTIYQKPSDGMILSYLFDLIRQFISDYQFQVSVVNAKNKKNSSRNGIIFNFVEKKLKETPSLISSTIDINDIPVVSYYKKFYKED